MAGDAGAGLHGGGQGGQRERALAAQAAGRSAGASAHHGAGHAGCAGGPAGGLWALALVHVLVHRAARAGVRQGHRGRGAQHFAQGVLAPARAEPALSPGAPDRRHDPRHRARHAGGALADLVLALQHHPHADRGGAGADPARRQVRRDVCRDHADGPGGVRGLHRDRHAVAHPVPARDERAGFQGPHPGGGFAVELRDGQVLQQRGFRGPPV